MVAFSPSSCFYQVFPPRNTNHIWRISSLFLFQNKDNCHISKLQSTDKDAGATGLPE